MKHHKIGVVPETKRVNFRSNDEYLSHLVRDGKRRSTHKCKTLAKDLDNPLELRVYKLDLNCVLPRNATLHYPPYFHKRPCPSLHSTILVSSTRPSPSVIGDVPSLDMGTPV